MKARRTAGIDLSTADGRQAARTRYHALVAQAIYLRSPERRDGPAQGEAGEVAAAMEEEAEEIVRGLFRQMIALRS